MSNKRDWLGIAIVVAMVALLIIVLNALPNNVGGERTGHATWTAWTGVMAQFNCPV